MICMLLIVLALMPLNLHAEATQPGQITVSVLPNGMKLIVREGRQAPLATLDIWVRAGSAYETPDNNGISHFVEHMIFKTTSKYGPGQIDREIEGMGAELNGGTSKDWMHFYTTVAAEYLPSAVDVLADAITTAQFKEQDIAKERQVILDEIARAESKQDKRVMELFAGLAYGSHPYSLSPQGTRDVIGALTRDQLISYYKMMYVPSNVCVVIAGDVSAASAADMVKSAFAGFKSPVKPVASVSMAKSEPAKSLPNAVKYELPIKQTHVVLGFMAASASDLRDSTALDVMLSILGGTNSGRICDALTASKIHFTGIDADFITQKQPSMFTVHVTADLADVDKIPSIILTELRRLAVEHSEMRELFHAKRVVEGADLFEQETFSGQARALGMYDMIATWDMSLKYAPTIRDLTPEDIRLTAAKYFSKDNYTLLVVEPEASK
ncbi:MAG: M16 family metallopeptidase [Armatimonadota bacterium]